MIFNYQLLKSLKTLFHFVSLVFCKILIIQCVKSKSCFICFIVSPFRETSIATG
jgi:hypothetical protein